MTLSHKKRREKKTMKRAKKREKERRYHEDRLNFSKAKIKNATRTHINSQNFNHKKEKPIVIALKVC